MDSVFVSKAIGDVFVINNEYHNLTVKNLDSYESSVFLEGINFSNESHYLTFYINETSELIDFELFYLKNGNQKKINTSKDLIVSTMDYSTFFSGRKQYSIKIDPVTTFEFKYMTKDQNTLFLSSFQKKGIFDSKNVRYTVTLPADLVLSARNKEINLQTRIEIDTTYFPDSTTFIPFLIHPKSIDKNEFFSNWFSEKLVHLNIIDENTIPLELVEISKKEKKEVLAMACFEYVKKQIKYIDIENGMNAIVPRSCSEVMAKKMGDCKDMANLIVGLLRYFDFKVYHAISRTFTKKDTLNFPSISLGNHMIAVLQLDEKWIFLDATEDECLFGDPSIQIIGTEVFLIGNNDNYYLKVPQELHYASKIDLKYSIQKPSGTNSKLTLEITSFGKMNYRFYSKLLYENLNQESLNMYIQDRFRTKLNLVNYPLST